MWSHCDGLPTENTSFRNTSKHITQTHRGYHARSSLRHHHEDRDRQSQSRPQSHCHRHHSLRHHNSHRGYSRSQHRDRHNHHRSSSTDLTQPTEDAATDLAVTLHTGHIADHPKIEALQVINSKIAVDHIHNHPIDLQDINLANQIHIPAGQEVNHILRRP